MSNKKNKTESHTGNGKPVQEVKSQQAGQCFLLNRSQLKISIDGVGVLPPGKKVPIPGKVLDKVLADEEGMKKLKVSVV